MSKVCYWCRSPAPSDYPCCVPAWFWQIGVQESSRRALEQLRTDHLPNRLDRCFKFFPPDNNTEMDKK